jgi:hypothetical protein
MPYPKPTTDEAESLPPLPRPFMEKFGRVSPEVYDPWAAQMRTYALQAIASLKAPAADGWMPIESAPTSEAEPFLVLRHGIAVQVSWFEGRLYPDALEACVDFDDGIADATHWMYRPQPPKETPK